jgi:DNA invertase Pin-like site-specific DNA recombinase
MPACVELAFPRNDHGAAISTRLRVHLEARGAHSFSTVVAPVTISLAAATSRFEPCELFISIHPKRSCAEIKTFGKTPCPNRFSGLPKDMTESEPQNRRLGYARVSTYGQTLDAQLEQLRRDGCSTVYREKASGAQAERRELQRMLKAIQPGDMVTVTRIDRLARSTFDLFAIVKAITDAGGQFRSLAEPWADTATSTGRLMIAVLGGLADVERDLIRTRTAEGRSRAKGRGQHMGRLPALTPQQQAEARQRRADGATLKELAQSYNVGIATISRLSSRVAG